jgi:hypothetical protein
MEWKGSGGLWPVNLPAERIAGPFGPAFTAVGMGALARDDFLGLRSAARQEARVAPAQECFWEPIALGV